MVNRLFTVMAITLGLLGYSISASVAHTGYYPQKWASTIVPVDWKFVSGVPTSPTTLRNRIQDGAQSWNGVDANFSFRLQSGDYGAFSGTSCQPLSNVEKNGIHWGNIDGAFGYGATAVICSYGDVGGSGTNLHNFQIKFDSSENWFLDSGTNIGSQQADLWSLATHEFGHATGRGKTPGGPGTAGDGLGHFPTNFDVCNGTLQHHTMCPSTGTGQTRDRNLEEHDKDGLQGAY